MVPGLTRQDAIALPPPLLLTGEGGRVTEAPSPLPASPLRGSERTSEHHPLYAIPTYIHYSFLVIGLSCLLVCLKKKKTAGRGWAIQTHLPGDPLKALGMKEALLPSYSEFSASQRKLVGQGWLVEARRSAWRRS